MSIEKQDVYTKTASDTKFLAITDVGTITEVGALNAGSITSGFGSIDVGADSIKSGSLEVGSIKVGTDTIGHGADTDLITLANNSGNCQRNYYHNSISNWKFNTWWNSCYSYCGTY